MPAAGIPCCLYQELQQQQEEGERLQDQRLQSLALQQHDELLRRSQLQRRMLQQQQQQLLREEEGRSLQDPNFSSLLRLSRSPRNNSNGSSSNDEERPYVPRFLSLGSLGLNPVQIRLLLREGLAANPDIEELGTTCCFCCCGCSCGCSCCGIPCLSYGGHCYSHCGRCWCWCCCWAGAAAVGAALAVACFSCCCWCNNTKETLFILFF